MVKWADYCISAVRYNSNGTHIEKVQVHEDQDSSIGSPQTWTRSQVIDALDKRYTFVTITKNGNTWNKGADVHKVIVNNKKYIRTDKNQSASDNLGKLPRF